MASPFREDAHRRLRESALDVAAEEVVAHGWRGLQVRSVATRTGVSRQTLYTAFGDKHGLSRALVLRHTERLLDAITAEMAGHATLHERWAAAVGVVLAAAAADPLVKAVLLSDSSAEFLPLLTSRGAPVLAMAAERLTAAVLEGHPDLDPARVLAAADAVTRLTLSHLVLPLRAADTVAEEIAAMATRYLAPREG